MDELENISQNLGAEGTPTQPASETPGGASSISAKDLAKALKDDPTLLNTLKNLVLADQQSAKDKRIQGVEGEVRNIRSLLDELKAIKGKGFTEDQAVFLMERLQASPTSATNSSPAQPPVGNQGQTQAEPGVQAVLQAFDLMNDPEAVAALREGKLKDVNAARAFVTGRLTKQPPPNPAVMAQPNMGSAPSVDPDKITARLGELMKFPTKHAAEIKTLTTQLEGLIRKA